MNASPPNQAARVCHAAMPFSRALACGVRGGPPRGPGRGWTLIELLGVMAIIAILAAAVTPAIIRELERAARQAETDDLEQLREGLVRYVVRKHVIPNHTAIASALGAELGRDPATVLLTRQGLARVYLIDPALRIGTNASSQLTFTQTAKGSLQPVSPRVLFISSIGTALPTSIQNGVASSASAFEAIWTAKEGTIPSGWSWTGKGDDLRISRVDLSALFVPLILNNDSTTYGKYAVDGSAQVSLTTNSWSAYFLRGTVLGLYSSAGVLQSTEVLQDACSYVYEKEVWRGKLFMSPSARKLSGLDLQAAYDLFMSSPWNDGAKFGTTQAEVTSAMFEYMSNYVLWANSGFSSSLKGAVASSQVLMATKTKNYLFKAGTK